MSYSILVPIYNVQKYLSRCLDSILAQANADYEIILVDDGSTDDSGKICDAYCKQHPDKFKVIHKQNQGLLSARRVGIAHAQGEYVCFLDSDDYWMPHTLETIDARLKESHADVLIFGHSLVDVQGEVLETNHPCISEGVYTGAKKQLVLETLLETTSMNAIWAKCVRRTCIDSDRDYSPFYSVSSGEDLLQTLPIFDRAKTIAVIHTPLYNYMQNAQSITQGKYLERHISSTFLVFRELGTYIEKWNLSQKAYIQRMGLSILYTIKQLIRRSSGPGAYTIEERNAILDRLHQDDILSVIPKYSASGEPISLQICYYFFSKGNDMLFSLSTSVFGVVYRIKLLLNLKRAM